MRQLFLILFLVSNIGLFAQSDSFVGNYVRNPKLSDGSIHKWTLSLNTDGTFIYNFYRVIAGDKKHEENFYGKGTWKAEKNLIFFFADKKKDIDETHTKNFNNSRARINSKSPRDKSNKIIKTSLRFFESEIPEITGLELFKE